MIGINTMKTETKIAALALILSTGAATASDVKLVVQITVDGFRGDLISRYSDSFGDGGFRRLTDTGVWYTDAHHMHANTETIVGHTTLSTGAHHLRTRYDRECVAGPCNR